MNVDDIIESDEGEYRATAILLTGYDIFFSSGTAIQYSQQQCEPMFI